MAATIIDNGGTGFSDSGTWMSGGGSQQYGTSYLYAAPGATTSIASYNFTGLTASTTYWIAITWYPYYNRSTVAPWKIYDSNGSTLLTSGTMNQVNAPIGKAYTSTNTVQFQLVGSATPSGTSLTVKISGVAGGYVIADAVLLQPATDPRGCAQLTAGTWGTAANWAASELPGAGDYAFLNANSTLAASTSIGLAAFTTGGQPALTINASVSLDDQHRADAHAFRRPPARLCIESVGGARVDDQLQVAPAASKPCGTSGRVARRPPYRETAVARARSRATPA